MFYVQDSPLLPSKSWPNGQRAGKTGRTRTTSRKIRSLTQVKAALVSSLRITAEEPQRRDHYPMRDCPHPE
jgi:hypothetical protein